MSDTFLHRWVPGTSAETLLLLHGTGGNEEDLLPLGQALLPGANRLSPRGRVLEGRMPRFFRRLAEGVFDLESLRSETDALGRFITAAATERGFDPARVTAVGFSNGANIAASLLLRQPGLLRRAVLFRAMVPFEPDSSAVVPGVRAWLGAGRQDPIVPPENTERLGRLLQAVGVDVTLHWENVGHQLAGPEVEAAARWLAGT